MKLYKLTNANGQTRNHMQWGENVTHSVYGEPVLCSNTAIHAYEHPMLAVLMNTLHVRFQNPRLWEAEGDVVVRDGQLICGVQSLTTIREILLPDVNITQRIKFAILCAKKAGGAGIPLWSIWADKWLSGEDRSKGLADAAARATCAIAKSHVFTALRAVYAAVYATEASCAYAAEGANKEGIDMIAIIDDMMK